MFLAECALDCELRRQGRRKLGCGLPSHRQAAAFFRPVRRKGCDDRVAPGPHGPRRLRHVRGPHPAIDSNDPGAAGFSGRLIVAEFDSLSAAQSWADADPYRAAGVYANVLVEPFKQVLP